MLIDILLIFVCIFFIAVLSCLLFYSKHPIRYFSNMVFTFVIIIAANKIFYIGADGYLWFLLSLYSVLLAILYAKTIPKIVYNQHAVKLFTIKNIKKAAISSSIIGSLLVCIFTVIFLFDASQKEYLESLITLWGVYVLMNISYLLSAMDKETDIDKKDVHNGKPTMDIEIIEKSDDEIKVQAKIFKKMNLMVCLNCGSKITDDELEIDSGCIVTQCKYCGSLMQYE